MKTSTPPWSIAFKQGCDARVGGTIAVNPYPYGSQESIDWESGWKYADSRGIRVSASLFTRDVFAKPSLK